jgi:hypothetical protein
MSQSESDPQCTSAAIWSMHRQHRRTCTTLLLLFEMDVLLPQLLNFLILQSIFPVLQSNFLGSVLAEVVPLITATTIIALLQASTLHGDLIRLTIYFV